MGHLYIPMKGIEVLDKHGIREIIDKNLNKLMSNYRIEEYPYSSLRNRIHNLNNRKLEDGLKEVAKDCSIHEKAAEMMVTVYAKDRIVEKIAEEENISTKGSTFEEYEKEVIERGKERGFEVFKVDTREEMKKCTDDHLR